MSYELVERLSAPGSSLLRRTDRCDGELPTDPSMRADHFIRAKIYDTQRKAGGYFVHEHPKSTSSWKESSINGIAEDHEVFKAKRACAP